MSSSCAPAPPHTETADPARLVLQQVLRCLADGYPTVLVSSPPGGGKTWLIEALAWVQTQYVRRPCWVATTTINQADDLARRLERHWDWGPGRPLPIRRLVAREQGGDGGPVPRPEVLDPGLLQQPWVWLATARKLSYTFRPPRKALGVAPPKLDLLILDEAYQLRMADLATFSHPFQQLVLIGDPGQLDPVVTLGVATPGAPQGPAPHLAAPHQLLALQPEQTAEVKIPYTRRLPQDSARVVSRILYPSLPFESLGAFPAAVGVSDPLAPWRALGGPWAQAASGGHTVVLAQLASELPSAAQRAAAGAAWVQAMVNAGVAPNQIGVVCSHREEVVQQTAALGDWQGQVRVETAERWQGREVDWMLAWHPADSAERPGEFSANAGRLCVMLSRHRRGCAVLSSAGTWARVQRLGSGEPELAYPAPRVPGWQAHRKLYEWAQAEGRVLPLDPR